MQPIPQSFLHASSAATNLEAQLAQTDQTLNRLQALASDIQNRCLSKEPTLTTVVHSDLLCLRARSIPGFSQACESTRCYLDAPRITVQTLLNIVTKLRETHTATKTQLEAQLRAAYGFAPQTLDQQQLGLAQLQQQQQLWQAQLQQQLLAQRQLGLAQRQHQLHPSPETEAILTEAQQIWQSIFQPR